MNKIELNNIDIPDKLPLIVNQAINRAQKDGRRKIIGKPVLAIAAVVVLSMTVLNFNIIADTIKKIFLSAEKDSSLSAFIEPIIENDYFDSPEKETAVSISNDISMELLNYFIDSKEIGFEFLLSGIDLDEYSKIDIMNYNLEINGAEKLVWEYVYDENAEYVSRTFPNGYFWVDYVSGERDYKEGNDVYRFGTNHEKVDDKRYNVVYTMSFEQPFEIGNRLLFEIKSLQLRKPFLESKDDSNYIAPDYIHGNWSFALTIDDKFKQPPKQCDFTVQNANELSEQGIEIKGIVISPTKTEIILSVDYDKANISDCVSEPKMRNMDLSAAIKLYSNDKEAAYTSSSVNYNDGNVSECIIAFSSIYFKGPNNLKMTIKKLDKSFIIAEIELS